MRAMFKKMLILERSPEAGEPLLGALIGFRKIVVGDRDWRIVWRVVEDGGSRPILDISEIWAAGARADSEVYEELKTRIEKLGKNPKTQPLAEVIERMGRFYDRIEAKAEPVRATGLPDWLATALKLQLGLDDDAISGLSEEQAQTLLVEHWQSKKGE